MFTKLGGGCLIVALTSTDAIDNVLVKHAVINGCSVYRYR
jgi:hypothetical protein